MLDLKTLYPFELDDFQQQAIDAIDNNRSVVVCAPTGSGKTLIGEYAIFRALARQKRAFYTTPLKALSNQKLRDFRAQFGEEQVGLLTGDVSINRDAPILVMTTEIFRNMLYGTPIGEVGTSLQDVEAVVLDECHYMNDRQRGTVWEESIIYCPPNVQLIALSATIANSEQLTDWIDQVHGPTELIYSEFRPVPLEFSFCNPKGLFPLLDSKGKKLNPRLKPKGGSRDRGRSRQGKSSRPEAPSLPFVINQLDQRDMLPAIYFIFSRRGCDRAVSDVEHLNLVNPAEARLLKQQIDEFLARNPEAAREGQVEPLYRGIAAHHAGILPAWKGLVEELFQQGLIKVVFATETLAAGINMPARTTVISSLSKRTDLGHRLLNPSEFLQMSGRAGRRGMDVVGYVVTVQTRFEGAPEASYLATAGADPLVSQFTPNYGMVLNLLQTHTLDEAKDLVERSFGQYLATLHLSPQRVAIDDIKSEIEYNRSILESVNEDDLASYAKLQGRHREEKRLLKILQQQAEDVLTQDLPLALSFAIAGTVLSLRGKNVASIDAIPAVLVMKVPGSGQFPYLICLGQNNRWYVVHVKDVVGLHSEFPRIAAVDSLTPPEDMPTKPGQQRSGDETTGAIAEQVPTPTPPYETAPEVVEQAERLRAVEAEMAQHPAREINNPSYFLKRQKRLRRLEQDLRDRQSKLDNLLHHNWQEFLNLIKILEAFGCLIDDKPTEMGEIAAALRGDNELWLGLAVASRELDQLAPHHFAAVCAALVTEISRPDSWTHYKVSPEVEDALGGLRGIRRQLFQLQRRYQIALPVWLETEMIGLVEQWALETDWSELCSNTSLDEGDVVRMLRRTLDFLSQIPHVPHISDQLRTTARQASRLLDRFPVNETIE
ncbi:MAG: DEAD/DEAH box helicase [Thainema sp.]